ncbi:hypothetical protein ACFVY9_15950 [Streptomyces sp. NPDC059544]|uniref:hypothetical protein n=1 Tax=Streptomyces sp. NPDC059544 TaxID=3346861 RepID=UPI0036AABAD1
MTNEQLTALADELRLRQVHGAHLRAGACISDPRREKVVPMVESWAFADGTVPLAADEAVKALQRAIAAGKLESWLISSSGRLLAVVSNTERAMVMLLECEGDPGKHAVDPTAEGWSGGFVLANGQSDEYPDADTVPLAEALGVVHHVLAVGTPPVETAWMR